jgi:hypothetical protein
VALFPEVAIPLPLAVLTQCSPKPRSCEVDKHEGLIRLLSNKHNMYDSRLAPASCRASPQHALSAHS